jgi:hypothetical protein
MQLESSQPVFQSFRDPAGSLELRPDAAYRRVRSPEAEEILAFLATPLAAQLVEQGRLSASVLVSRETIPADTASTQTDPDGMAPRPLARRRRGDSDPLHRPARTRLDPQGRHSA